MVLFRSLGGPSRKLQSRSPSSPGRSRPGSPDGIDPVFGTHAHSQSPRPRSPGWVVRPLSLIGARQIRILTGKDDLNEADSVKGHFSMLCMWVCSRIYLIHSRHFPPTVRQKREGWLGENACCESNMSACKPSFFLPCMQSLEEWLSFTAALVCMLQDRLSGLSLSVLSMEMTMVLSFIHS